MSRPRFYFLEPSKVGSQHITLIDGYLRALTLHSSIATNFDIVFSASASTTARISADARARVSAKTVPVMDPERRRLVRKSLLEFLVVFWGMLKKRRVDVLFVSCVLPTTLLMIEIANRLLRRRGVFVTLHGEIEGLYDPGVQRITNYGYWIQRWLRARNRRSLLNLVVIDDFIKETLVSSFGEKIRPARVFVIHHPIVVQELTSPSRPSSDSARACFIGYRTKAKGFDRVVDLASRIPASTFLAVGGGKVEDVRSGATSLLAGSVDYLHAISECDVALFPYVAGYGCSLSAAAVDALAMGVHLVATDRQCFLSLRARLGADFVTICKSQDEFLTFMEKSSNLKALSAGQFARQGQLTASVYGMRLVGASFDQLVECERGHDGE